MAGPPGEQKSKYITQVVASVREKGERMSEDAKDNLNNDVSEIQGRADGKRFAEIFWRVAVSQPTMMMTLVSVVVRLVTIIVSVIIVVMGGVSRHNKQISRRGGSMRVPVKCFWNVRRRVFQ